MQARTGDRLAKWQELTLTLNETARYDEWLGEDAAACPAGAAASRFVEEALERDLSLAELATAISTLHDSVYHLDRDVTDSS